MTPAGVTQPTFSPNASMNHTFPSGPGAIETADANGVGRVKSETAPAGVIRPMLWNVPVNHKLPSGPAVISRANAPAGSANSVTVPAGVVEVLTAVIRPIVAPALN